MPKRKLIDLETFRAAARAGNAPNTAIFRVQVSEPKALGDDSRKIRFCFSDGSVDRVGDTIDPRGWDVTGFTKNPVALWAHDSFEPPIGRASNLLVEDLRLMGDIEFASPDLYPFADTIYRLVKAKYINATSVGFIPLEYHWSDDDDREYGIDFERQELVEISVVPVPCNSNALAEARAKGIDTRPLVEWAERTLDSGGKIIIPRAELERLRKAAKEPTAMSRKPKADVADWKAGAARDLPIDDSESWDGAAAEASIFEHSGGDDFDPAKAKLGFLVYDAAKPKLRGSYKLPFAHVVGGEMKAVKGGIKAAASRLPQTDVPQVAKDEARKVIDAYEAKMDAGDKDAGHRRRKDDGMEETDPSGGGFLGNCGRLADDECGMKDPMECAVHGPLLNSEEDNPKGLVAGFLRRLDLLMPKAQSYLRAKSGRVLSAANEAKLKEAVGHHEAAQASHVKCLEHQAAAVASHAKAMKCIKDVLDGVDPEADEPEENPDPDDEAGKATRAREVETARLSVI